MQKTPFVSANEAFYIGKTVVLLYKTILGGKPWLKQEPCFEGIEPFNKDEQEKAKTYVLLNTHDRYVILAYEIKLNFTKCNFWL